MDFPNFSVLCFLSLLVSLFSPSTTTTTTIPLSHFPQNPSSPDLDHQDHLASLVSQSLARASRLKNPQNAPPPPPAAAPLSSHSYGGYSIPLSFGTPPQTLEFILDTGSDIVWFPCTHKYICKNCSFPGTDSVDKLPRFIPKSSSSVKILGCLNPKCGWIHHTNETQCRDCEPGARNCTEICSPYFILYGSGSTGGFGLVDTLDLPGPQKKKVPNFAVGCSVVSSRQPAGIAGFGRGLASLPSQLGLAKFSFCLLSRKFDDTPKTTDLLLDAAPHSSTQKTQNLTYTPFLKNPTIPGKHAFSVYYYLHLRKISIGGKSVKIPYAYLNPGSNGNGGTIVDSGSTFTYMSRNIFELVLRALVAQTKGYKRAMQTELVTGLRPCFDVAGLRTVKLPEMRWHFKGGAEMVLPLENYFILAAESGAVCLAMVTDDHLIGAAGSDGPGIILGSFQMQNFYLEYDLRNERFGFSQQRC